MAQHAQGPWFVFSKYSPANQLQIGKRTKHGSYAIGAVYDKDAEAQATAHLIAAAPDLLEALTLILENPDHDLLDIERETAEAAIAKAQGGSQ